MSASLFKSEFGREKRIRYCPPQPRRVVRSLVVVEVCQEMTEKHQSKVKAIVRIRPFLPNEVPASCVHVTAPGQMELRNLKFNPPTEAVNYKCVLIVLRRHSSHAYAVNQA